MGLKRKIRKILNELESVREKLLSLSDDIWPRIDHNDSEAVQEDADFKVAYNQKMAEFGTGNGGFLPGGHPPSRGLTARRLEFRSAFSGRASYEHICRPGRGQEHVKNDDS